MRRGYVCVVLVVLVVLVFACAVMAQRPQVKPIKPTVKPPTAAVGTLQLSKQFQDVLKAKNVKAETENSAIGKFQRLPVDLQKDIVRVIDESKAQTQLYLPETVVRHKLPDKLTPIRPDIYKLFTISSIWPQHGQCPGAWAYVRGINFNSNCQVIFNGSSQTTHYLDFNLEFFPNSLAFAVPGLPLAHDYPLKVHNTVSNKDTGEKQYRVIAPRGYRGYNGWQFSNFSDPQIPWACYRDFFGASAVEYSNGAHRPSAQAWYDADYKGVGGGGNCYGMSVSSIRGMRNEITTLHQSWFNNNHEDFVWLYPWNTQTKQTVQEDQGGQLSAEMAATINNLWNNQSHQQAWTRAQNLTHTTGQYAILGFWGANWGHAVVCYNTEVDGNERKLLMYDNNVPYRENETGGPDKSISIVNWNTNSYSYPGTSANKMVCMSFAETMEGPSLPAAATGGAMGTVIATVNGGNVTQITDGDGHTFFSADGSVNTNEATRIPNSMKFVPLTGTTPTNFPDTFIFSEITGGDLTFTVQGAGNKSFRMFQSGDVFQADFSGQGDLRCAKILTDERALVIGDPGALQPVGVKMIKVLPSERVFKMENLNWIGTEGITLHPTADSLDVLSSENLRFNMQFETFGQNAVQTQSFRNVAIQANQKGVVSPTNWNNLRGSQLNLKLLNPNTNQQIRDINIRPIQ